MSEHTQSTTPSSVTTDPRELLDRALATAAETVALVRPEQLNGPTPCDDFDVRTLLGHLVEVADRIRALGVGDDPFGDVGVGDVAGDGWAAAFADASKAARAAWADGTAMERTITLPWETGPGRQILVGYLSELTVHTWDLARAIGHEPAWDDEVIVASLGSIADSLPATGRQALFDAVRATMPEEMRTSPPPFADAVPVPDDAPAIDRLVAWTGRRP